MFNMSTATIPETFGNREETQANQETLLDRGSDSSGDYNPDATVEGYGSIKINRVMQRELPQKNEINSGKLKT